MSVTLSVILITTISYLLPGTGTALGPAYILSIRHQHVDVINITLVTRAYFVNHRYTFPSLFVCQSDFENSKTH